MRTTECTVGEILRLVRRPVAVEPDGTYQEIGIRSFGRGVFHKTPVLGYELGNKRVFHIEPGDLLFNNVFAWEGAVARATDCERGMIGSHRFMTYRVNESLADAAYLRYFFISERGLAVLQRASPGSAGRNKTLGIKALERERILLPALDEQRRIAAELDRAVKHAETLEMRYRSQRARVSTLIEAATSLVLIRGLGRDWRLRPLGEIATINPRPKPLRGEQLIAFVPMAAVSEITGTVEAHHYRAADEVGSGYKQFESGDVIFARITPCMENGKSAVFADPQTEIGLGSTEFHVIRPSSEVLAAWIHRCVRTLDFRRSAMASFTGTAGQQRVPADFLYYARIPLPSTIEDQEKALAEIKGIHNRGLRLHGLGAAQQERIHALRPSLLNAAFTCRP